MKLKEKNILRAISMQRRRAIENTMHQLPMENTNANVEPDKNPVMSSKATQLQEPKQ